MHYRALQQHAKTDVRFVLFPGEKHGPTKLAHQRRKVEEELAWFDRYLFQTHKDGDESVKDDSPLARALKLRSAKRDQNRYGEKRNGQLVPETVPYAGIQVGRFEVTRAQFACFDRSYPVPPGKENYPAAGISFEQAQDYCRWLSKRTSETYRLPNEEEAEELYGEAEAGENTLDHWAGYPVNPDDARQLREKLRELGPAALLREVGSFGATGKEQLVFDLGGNVAEWTVSDTGKPRLRGGSADCPADAKQRTSNAAKEYQGFRVIREATAKP
jgi:formylglycine-generating enzyme required for sulfatase activity